ncbi:DUF4437 domain-containing protein [Polaribacter sp. Hel1_85]|uniref:DUF4437 domain-containing protein n=1 Tax=Polaribacter sp. Hel1_85 TaxID=1250005 RepID=UPI00052D2C25|nr:DUF4437 domain-containing protein [Polaribacter sp. Hel1_85]KGL63423.1 cupin, RmlC-type [Polaribacter sp. Hel1_85]
MKKYIILILFLALGISCKNKVESNTAKSNAISITKVTNKVKLASEIEWEQLNPARGENSPKAGTIWGDRKANEATGFLAKFTKGFSSPPHIHNVSYHGIVISGSIHNDDPHAEKMWMPAGSYWTQPEGEAHITAANASENVAYIEIEKGPYLVHPTEAAFDNGERPINVDKSNLVWLDASDISWIENSENHKIKAAFLWGNKHNQELYGTFIKIAPGFKGKILSEGKIFRGIVIQGNINYQMPSNPKNYVLAPGSTFSATENSKHFISINEEVIIYLRTNGNFVVSSK